MYCEYVKVHELEKRNNVQQFYPIKYQQEEINQRIEYLQQWLANEREIYFDCVERLENNDNLREMPSKYQPWISEICLSVHRKTGFSRRFINCFNRSKRSKLSNLAAEFVRIYNGYFNYPIGYRFHISYAKEKWLLILKDLKIINYPIYPYPPTRILLIRKGVSCIAK